jgi:hypothetical protein
MQPCDQAAGQFAPSEMKIHEGYVRSVLGEQAAVVAAGPTTTAPKSSSRSFTASPTLQESSTNRISKPLRSSDDPAPAGSWVFDGVIGYFVAIVSRPCLSAKYSAVECSKRQPVRCTPTKSVQLRGLAAESAHRVTGVASLILLADIGDQRLRALYLDFEGGDQRIFRINDDVSRFSLNFKADRKLHLCSPPSTFNG